VRVRRFEPPTGIRFTPHDKQIITAAADLAGVGWTTFIREASVAAARKALSHEDADIETRLTAIADLVQQAIRKARGEESEVER
jgi:uncharacterized protein (DUF1778 family)